MPAGKARASTAAAVVAPRACPISRVVSSIPDAAPLCLRGSEFITVALLIGLNMFVPTEIGIIRSGRTQKEISDPTRLSTRKPPAMITIMIGLISGGLYLS